MIAFLSAMLFGFLGSFHCVGMCGPIALSLPVQHLHGTAKALGIGLYNFGRITTYIFIGIVFGIIGFSFQYFGWQQIFSIVLGISLLVLFLITLVSRKKRYRHASFQKWNQWVIGFLSPLMHSRRMSRLFIIGLLNGLLPCGLIYMALAGAMATGNIFSSALFMAGFGAGTLPAMAIACYASGWITLPLRNRIKKMVPYVLVIMGVLLILRGMNLEIPFISPTLQHSAAVQCH